MTVTNETRACWAEDALSAFFPVEDGQDEQNARDLITDLGHYLMLRCGLNLEEARNAMGAATRMFEDEVEEDD